MQESVAAHDPAGLPHSSVMHLVRRGDLPGLAVVALGVLVAFLLGWFVVVSPLVAGVVLGARVADTGLLCTRVRPGFSFAA